MQSLAVPAQPKVEEKDTLPIVHRHEIIKAYKCTALWRYHCEQMMWVSALSPNGPARQEEKANFGTVHSSAPSLPRQAEVKAEEPEMS